VPLRDTVRRPVNLRCLRRFTTWGRIAIIADAGAAPAHPRKTAVHLESLSLTNFRCFGPDPETVTFGPELTTFIGTNGSGKTAVMLALLRMLGVSNYYHHQPRFRRVAERLQ
jgi:hypothetical protein